jgi:hypothetical protein
VENLTHGVEFTVPGRHRQSETARPRETRTGVSPNYQIVVSQRNENWGALSTVQQLSILKSKNGKELIVEWHRNAHVFDGYLIGSMDFFQIVAQASPNENGTDWQAVT